MRFLKTFFRFFTIVTLCTTFTGATFAACSDNDSIYKCKDAAGCYWDGNGLLYGDHCYICNAGYYCAANEKDREQCSVGNYCPLGSSSQTPCQQGYYCPNAATRTPCPAGTYNNKTGQTSESSCTTCTGSGTYCPAGATSPQACSAGYYCPNTTTRTACPAGTYNSKTAQSSSSACITCPDGTFSASTGQTTVCPQCPAGYYCPDTKTKHGCPSGKFCPAGSVSSSDCYANTSGKFPETTGTNKTSLSDCCKTITAGKYYRTDTETIYKCEDGYFCVGATVCYGSTNSYAGRNQCNQDTNGRTVHSAGKTQDTGATQDTDCYVSCSREEVSGGYYPEENINYSIIQPANGKIPAVYGYGSCPKDDPLTRPNCYPGYTLDTMLIKFCTANSYTIQYSSGQSSGVSGSTGNTTHTYDINGTLASNGFTYGTKRFDGWSYNGKTYNAGETVKNLTSENNVTLTFIAIWGNCTPCAAGADATCTLSAPQGNCTYVTSCNNGYENIVNNGKYNPSCSPKTYKVTLNKSDGTGGTNEYWYKYNTSSNGCYYYSNQACTTCISNSKFTPPSKTGYTFNGYFTGENGAGTKYIDANGNGTNNIYQTIGHHTLYAYWTPNTYKVTLDRQGGKGGISEYYYQYQTKGKCYYYTTSGLTTCVDGTDGDTIATPTRDGYTFDGYFAATNGGGTQYVNANGGTINNLYNSKASDTNLYAKWTAKSYNVILDTGATDATAGTTNITPTYDSAMPTPITLPRRSGYTFNGYYDGGGKQYYTSTGESANNWDKASENVTLTAEWTPCDNNYYCDGTASDSKSKCPDAFIYEKSEFDGKPAIGIENCYLNPILKLKDSIDTSKVTLQELSGTKVKIFYVGSGSQK